MTVVRLKNTMPQVNSFNNLLSDVFPQMPSLYRETLKAAVQVNISEADQEFVVELLAPGHAKEDFEIGVEKKMLTVRVEEKEGNTIDGVKYISQQFKPAFFSRSFTLDEKIDTERISAEYLNGILKIKLGKKAEATVPSRQIKID